MGAAKANAEEATPPPAPRLPMVMRALVEAGVAVGGCVVLGHTLEYLASKRYFGLHHVPLGPNRGFDPYSSPMPFGEHGWEPVPLGLMGVALIWNGAPRWHPTSWWSKCLGAVWGQLSTLIVCALCILPTGLAAWLQWLPYVCSPLAGLLATSVAALSATSLLFWADMMPLLPRTHPTPHRPDLVLVPHRRYPHG